MYLVTGYTPNDGSRELDRAAWVNSNHGSALRVYRVCMCTWHSVLAYGALHAMSSVWQTSSVHMCEHSMTPSRFQHSKICPWSCPSRRTRHSTRILQQYTLGLVLSKLREHCSFISIPHPVRRPQRFPGTESVLNCPGHSRYAPWGAESLNLGTESFTSREAAVHVAQVSRFASCVVIRLLQLL